MATRLTLCSKGRHPMVGRNVQRDGRCRVCENERKRMYEANKRRVTQCSRCGVTYLVTYKSYRRHVTGEITPSCPECRTGVPVNVESEHVDFWLEGGVNGDLRWPELLRIADGLEVWFSTGVPYKGSGG